FWNTLAQDAKTGEYCFQLDEQWFTLNSNHLRKALEITPVDSAHPFESPPAGEQVMDFVNELGYPEEIHFVSRMHVNNLYQPWRAIISNVDYAKLLWEEFVQAIQTFFSHRANLNIPTKKSTPHVIPYCRFTKLIIYYLGSRHNIHRRPGSVVHSPYYQQYLEMAACKHTAKEGGKKKTNSKADKPKKPAPAKQSKPMKEKTTKPFPTKKVRNESSYSDELESFQALVGGVAIREPASGITQKLRVVEGNGKGIATDDQAAQSVLEPHMPKKKNDTSMNVVHDTPSPSDAETGADTERSNSEVDTEILDVAEEQGEDVSNMVALEERTVELDEGQAGSNPDPALASRITALEKRSVDLEQKTLNQDKSIEALRSRVYTLENHDLYAKIDKQVNETVKEVVHDALQALLLDRFRDLSEAKSYDDQDPPLPPPKNSDHSKKKRRNSDASTSQQPQGQQSSAWKTSETREATV
ncbi:hypothetical protein Tco_1426372, partial [Tanacetum coccineum]